MTTPHDLRCEIWVLARDEEDPAVVGICTCRDSLGHAPRDDEETGLAGICPARELAE